MELLEQIRDEFPDIIDAYVYGTTLHLLVPHGTAERFAGYQPQTIVPTLEDVFIYFVKSKRGELSA
jgi:ABC-2 type transport system ATP-binding protein